VKACMFKILLYLEFSFNLKTLNVLTEFPTIDPTPSILYFVTHQAHAEYVTCTWNSWGSWSATCGQDYSDSAQPKITQHVVNRPNCKTAFRQHAPAPNVQADCQLFISCEFYCLQLILCKLKDIFMNAKCVYRCDI
ncbi:hypothetical protein OS493_040200, partial [Desmophyllum pertusum]